MRGREPLLARKLRDTGWADLSTMIDWNTTPGRSHVWLIICALASVVVFPFIIFISVYVVPGIISNKYFATTVLALASPLLAHLAQTAVLVVALVAEIHVLLHHNLL